MQLRNVFACTEAGTSSTMAATSRTNTGNHVAEAFAGNDEHVELRESHKPTSETSTQDMATISSPKTTSDTNTQGLATIKLT
jgi:hypothetical protein